MLPMEVMATRTSSSETISFSVSPPPTLVMICVRRLSPYFSFKASNSCLTSCMRNGLLFSSDFSF